MSTLKISTSTTKNTNDEFNATKEAQAFCRVFSEIKAGFYDSINELESCNYNLFKEYSDTIKALIKSDFMYSEKEYPITTKDASGKKIPKLDKDNNPITASNKQMVTSLSDSGFKSTETILDELWSHIMTKGLYYVNDANDEKHAYNLIKLTVFRKLCDFTRSMKRNEPITNAIPLGGSTTNEDGDEIVTEFADTKVDVEYSAILWDAKNNIIHHNIKYLINNKKCHRMIAYIANVANISNGELFKLIYEEGYTSAIHQIVSALQDVEINISYLESMELKFPKAHNDINLHSIETWKSEGLKQIHEYMVKQELSY